MTTYADISSHSMSEILQPEALAPLRKHRVARLLINESSIVGEPSGKRKVAKRTAIAMATDKIENVAVGAGETYSYGSPLELVPSDKEQKIPSSMDALTLRMPGASHTQIMDAIRSLNPLTIDFLNDQYVELAESHELRDEFETLALFPSLTLNAGTTNEAMTFAFFLDAYMKVLDENPEHENLVHVGTVKSLKDLRTSLITGSGTGLANIWNDSDNVDFFRHMPNASRNGYRGSCMGIPFYTANKDLIQTANAGVDHVGATFCYGEGVTGKAGSVRGFAERCFGSDVRFTVAYDPEVDATSAIMRVKTDHGISTQEHGCKVIFKKD